MGIGSLFRRLRGDRRAMPDPGSPEFQKAIAGSALPGSTEMGQAGWVSAGERPTGSSAPPPAPTGPVSPESLIAAGVPPESARATAAALTQLQRAFGGDPSSVDLSGEQGFAQTLDLSGMAALRDRMEATLREHGVDPRSGQAVDAAAVPGLQDALMRVLSEHGVDVGD